MTSRPAPKRRAEKPRRGLSRSAGSSADTTPETTSRGRRVAGRTASPEGEATRSPQVVPTPLSGPSLSETTLIRTEITSTRTEITGQQPAVSATSDSPSAEPARRAITAEAGPSTAASASADRRSASADRRSGSEHGTSAAGRGAGAAAGAGTPSSYRGKRAAELPPIPAESTATIDAVSEHTTITERRSGELRAARRATPPGGRGTRTRTKDRGRFSRLPAPAVVGAAALIFAGFGAVAMSSAKPPVMETAEFQSLAANDVAATTEGRYDPNNPDVTRDFDRALIAKQAEQQAAQLTSALSELADKTEARSKELKKKQWVLPLTGYRLTARFGQSSSLWSTVHTGLDFAAPSGTPLVAIARGTVTSTGYDGAYGNKTVLTLEDGTEIWYCHQSSIKASVGDTVEPGNLIGYVGSTGNVTGPHLHLEVRPTPDTPVDPEPALRAHNVTP